MCKKQAVAAISVLSVLIFILAFPIMKAWAAGTGKGVIEGMVFIPGDPQYQGTVQMQAMPQGRSILDGGGGGGGDGGGGGGGGDGGYVEGGWRRLEPIEILENRVVKLENLNAGLYNLILEYGNQGEEKYQMSLKNIRVVEDQVTNLKNLMLKKGGNITGHIRYPGIAGCPETGNCPTATIHVVNFVGSNYQEAPSLLREKAITASNPNGSFTLTNLPEGTYAIAITPSDTTYARDVITNVHVISDTSISATPFGPLNLVSTIGPLKGSVILIDKYATGPHSGTYVRATSKEGRYRSYLQMTTETGSFDLGYIPKGFYTLFIQHHGYKVYESEVEVKDNTPLQEVTLYNGQRKICGRVSLSGTAGYSGDLNDDGQVNLTDALIALQIVGGMAPAVTANPARNIDADGKIGLAEAIYALQAAAGLRTLDSPLAGSLVLVPGTSLMAVTDAVGNFAIESVPDRGSNNYAYDIFVTRDGYQAVRQTTVAQSSTITDCSALQIQLAKNPTVPVGGQNVPTGSIAGRAWLKNDPDPSIIDISIDGTSIQAKPNGSGNYIMTQVPPGNYRLRYSASGYKTVVEAGLQVVADRTTEVRNIVLVPRNGLLKGRITLEGATDFAGIPIKVDPNEAQVPTYMTDVNGYFSIPVPENYNVITNQKCVLDNTPSGTGGCIAQSISYTVTAGGGVWAQSDYVAHIFTNVDVPAGETMDLGTVQLKKPPLPPTAVTAAQAGGTSVKIEWTASASPDIAGYNVYYGMSSAAVNQKANTSLITAQTDGKWQYTVTGLDKGIMYYFQAEAVGTNTLASIRNPQDGSCKWTLQPEYTGSVITGNYPFGSMPFDIALTADGTKGYVSSQANACLVSVDFSSQPPVTTGQINLPGASPQPTSMAFNAARNELYVVDGSNGKLYAVNTLTDTIDATPIVSVSSPKNVIVSADGSKIYLASVYGSADKVTIIDAATRQVDASVALGDVDPYGMAIAKNKLYVVGTYSASVFVIDLNSKTILKEIQVGTGAYEAIARTDGNYVYVSLSTVDGGIAVINTTTDTLEKTITIKNAGETNPQKNPRGMAVSGNILYVANWGIDSTLAMIDTNTNEKFVMANPPLIGGGSGSENLAVSPNGGKIYVVHSGAGTVKILSY